MRDTARRIPTISHLQFLALGLLTGGERPGRVIREVAADFGARQSAAAFYQMMARMERDGLVDGAYEQIMVGDQAVTQRRYRITPPGSRAWSQARAFYEAVAIAATEERWSRA